jgi:C4-type Zn-finger protein
MGDIPTDVEIEDSCPNEGMPRCPRCRRIIGAYSETFVKNIPYGDGSMTIWNYIPCRNCGYEIEVKYEWILVEDSNGRP